MAAHVAALRRGPGPGLVVGAFVVLAVGGLVTTWDGAWWVARLLETGTPSFLHGRMIGWLTQGPAVAARWLGQDQATVTLALGAGIAAIPCASLLAAWRVCGPDRRDLLVWPVLGLGLGALPGLAFVISEAFSAVSLGWPIVVAAAAGSTGRHRVVVALLAAALAITHPFAVPMLGLAAIAAVAVAVIQRPITGGDPGRADLRPALVLAVLAVVVAVRYLVLPSTYEADTLSLDRIATHLRGGVGGRPLLAVLLTWALGGWLIVRPGADRLGALVVGGFMVALVVVLAPWALDVGRWDQALMYRTFLLAASAPLVGMLIVAAIRRPPMPPLIHGLAIAGAGTVAIVVLLAQSLAWDWARDDLMSALEARSPGCVELDSLGLRPSALHHWGVTSFVLLAEAPSPRHLVIVDARCSDIDVATGVPLKIVDGTVVERLPTDGWFDVRAIAAAMADAPR